MEIARLWAELNVGGLDYESGQPLDYDTVVTRVASAVAPLLERAANSVGDARVPEYVGDDSDLLVDDAEES